MNPKFASFQPSQVAFVPLVYMGSGAIGALGSVVVFAKVDDDKQKYPAMGVVFKSRQEVDDAIEMMIEARNQMFPAEVN